MKNFMSSRISAKIFIPSRNLNDIIKGTPVLENNQNFLVTQVTERASMKRLNHDLYDSFSKNPLIRMSLQSQRASCVLDINDEDRKELAMVETPPIFIVPFESLMNCLIVYSVFESLNDISFRIK